MTDPIPPESAADAGQGYAIHSEAVWDYARRDYLDGDSAGAVCARYGIARSTFWDRAAAGGWRRRDQPPAALPPIRVDMPEDENLELYDMVDLVHLRLGQAVRAGRATEVSAWLRVMAQLDRPVRDLIEFCREDREHAASRAVAISDCSDSSD